MSLANIRAAAVQAVVAAPGFNAGEVAYPNAKFDPAGLAFWNQVAVVLADATPVTLGTDGEDNIGGYIQCLLHQPQNTGEATVLAKSDILRGHFYVGRNFSHGGNTITIAKNEPKPGYHSGAWWVLPFLVTFYSRLSRT